MDEHAIYTGFVVIVHTICSFCCYLHVIYSVFVVIVHEIYKAGYTCILQVYLLFAGRPEAVAA